MAGGTQLANVLDSIPYFATTGERDARFPSPDLNQRVQVGAEFQVWNGTAWYPIPISFGAADVKAFGAAGNGTTDDTAAVLAALAQAPTDPSNGGKAVYFPKGSYLVTDTILADTHRVYFTGDGAHCTRIIFNPSSAKPCFLFSLGGTGSGELFSGGIDGIALRSGNTVQKVGVELVDTSNIVIRDFEIHNSFSGNGTIGLYTKGREMVTLNRAIIATDRPIVLGVNPNAVAGSIYSIDHFHLFDLWLITLDATKYNIEIESGVELHHLTLDGYQSWNAGLGGLLWNDTTGTASCDNLVIKNVRMEQAEDGGYFVYLKHAFGFKGLTVENIDGQSAGNKHGLYLSKVNQAMLSNVLLDGLGSGDKALELGGNVSDLTLRNFYYGDGELDTTGHVRGDWVPGTVASGGVAFGHIGLTSDGFPVNARAYGAKGDGTTDDTAAIQAAIDAAIAANTSCTIPPGTYKIASGLTVALSGSSPKAFSLIGVPGQTVFVPTAAVTTAVTLATSTNSDGTTHSLTVYGIRLDGVNTSGATGWLVGDNAGNLSGRIRMEFCEALRFTDAGGKGIHVKNVVSASYRNCYFGRNYVNLHQESSDPNLPTVQTYVQCEFREAETDGVVIKNGYRTKFWGGCVFEANFGAGLRAVADASENITSLDIDGGWFEDNQRGAGTPANEFSIVADGTASGCTVSVRLANSEFAGASKAIDCNEVVNLVIDNCVFPNSADQVNLDAACVGYIINWPENNTQYLTAVTNLAAPNVAFVGDTQYSPKGARARYRVVEEEVTLNTGGVTTDTVALIPGNAIVDAVVVRITETITTAANWQVGDSTTANRFISSNSTLVAGTVVTGLNHWQGGVSTDAAGPVEMTGRVVRITTNANPGAGKIRVTIFARVFNGPTS